MAKNVSEKNRDIHDRGYYTSVERGEIWRLIQVITEMNTQISEDEDEDTVELANQVSDEQLGLIELHEQFND
jgi:hypothetical protein